MQLQLFLAEPVGGDDYIMREKVLSLWNKFGILDSIRLIYNKILIPEKNKSDELTNYYCKLEFNKPNIE